MNFLWITSQVWNRILRELVLAEQPLRTRQAEGYQAVSCDNLGLYADPLCSQKCRLIGPTSPFSTPEGGMEQPVPSGPPHPASSLIIPHCPLSSLIITPRHQWEVPFATSADAASSSFSCSRR